MKKIASKKYIVLFAVLVIIGFWLLVSGNNDTQKEEVVVERGSLTQELFETGSVEKGEDITLSFKDGGRIAEVLVEEGRAVERGDVIARLETEDLYLSLREAEAGLESARAGLDGVLEGAREADVDVYRAGVRSAEDALENARENLEKQERVAEQTLSSVHRGTAGSLGTVNLLGDVYSTIRDIELGVVDIAREYFSSMVVAETTSGRRSRDVIRRSAGRIEDYKNLATREQVDYGEKEQALKDTEKELRVIVGELDNLIKVAESDFYEDRFLESDVNLLREYRRTVNNNLSNVTSLLGSISSVSTEVDAKLTTARGSVRSAENALEEARKRLSQAVADPASAEVRAGEAGVAQAEARVSSIRRRISDATLTSPVSGTVSAVSARRGETVTGTAPIAVITPEEDLQIAVDVYEGDVAMVSVGNEVEVSFVAFPDREFAGEVVFVNPTGKMIDGVIYYEIKIALEEYPENVLPRMTVDVVIKTEEKENVLTLPERAVQRRDGERFVRVKTEEGYREAQVQTGIRGEGRKIEIIFGVEEGEVVLVD